ncbi:hypothetical protein LOD99_12333 [Oopsacas minuta]|uniref:ubiquitinyl hydrolase 1 n=1 Tax=Oopsacas minuta TaxID=111878 RepID=A0AAV7JF02_9METZ|nr:hypothetical protein LOD99_12333 [Oopsacas minuta]
MLSVQTSQKSPLSPSKPPIKDTTATTPTKPKTVVKKTFKLTYKQEGSQAQHVVQEITPDLTFSTLVRLAKVEFGICESKQRFKMGFPPRPIKMELDDPLVVSLFIIQCVCV